jgi:hypothetical protein
VELSIVDWIKTSKPTYITATYLSNQSAMLLSIDHLKSTSPFCLCIDATRKNHLFLCLIHVLPDWCNWRYKATGM